MSGMDARALLETLLAPGQHADESEPGIVTLMPARQRTAVHYDRVAAVYDRLISNRLYNRLIWDNLPANYVAFASDAINAAADGPHLDAGGGSLLFAAAAYQRSHRPIVVFDHSLVMLRRARARLAESGRQPSPNFVLVHGGLFAIPFRPGRFRTIMGMGLLHEIRRLLSGVLRSLESFRVQGNMAYAVAAQPDRPA